MKPNNNPMLPLLNFNLNFNLILNFLLLLLLILLLLFNLLLLSGCKQPTQPGLAAELQLTLEDVSCTEAWMKLTTTNLQLPTSITIKQNDVTRTTINLTTTDTLLYIDSLLPNRTYKFTAVATTTNTPSPTSNDLTTKTMDTTSHNFTWQSWEFGDNYCGSSGLFDVAIIDENNIWAVGQIYMRDSLGNCDPNAYNAVHWDGTKWQLKRIYYKGGFWVIRSIFAFNANDIWFSGYMRYYNGQFIELELPDILIGWGINKLWGSSSSDLYAVGNNGNIAHWDGVRWKRIESNIIDDIQGIYGCKNSNGEFEILSVASKEFHNVPTTLLKIVSQSSGIKKITHNLPLAMKDIWFKPQKRYIAVGDGVYSIKNLENSEGWKREVSSTINKWYSTAIDGENFNDIVVCCSGGELLHFNGIRWRNLTNQIGITGINRYAECKIKNGIIVSVGFTLSGQGIIVVGRRR